MPGKTFTTCGTPATCLPDLQQSMIFRGSFGKICSEDYFAPELIASKGKDGAEVTAFLTLTHGLVSGHTLAEWHLDIRRSSCEEGLASLFSAVEVDWWTLGILTFELCSGHPPFESATPMQIYSKARPKTNAQTPKRQRPARLCHSCWHQCIMLGRCRKASTRWSFQRSSVATSRPL